MFWNLSWLRKISVVILVLIFNHRICRAMRELIGKIAALIWPLR